MEKSPHALFERLFGAGFVEPGDEAVVDPRLGLRRSVLDAVTDRLNGLRKRLSAADRLRLEQHLGGVRDLELRLARMEANPPSLASCARPDEPQADEFFGDDILIRHRAIVDVLVMALACDQSRVFTDCFTRPVDNFIYPGTDSGHHRLTHDEMDPQPQVHQAVLQIMGELRYTIEALASIPEGEQTLLDHTLMLCTSEISFGRTHSLEDIPVVLAGSGGGVLKSNYHYRSETRESASALMLTLVRAMGILQSEFGLDDARATEGLEALWA